MRKKQFIGRTAELSGLQRRYEQAGAQLLLLYGRRRVGKTYLLEQFTATRHLIAQGILPGDAVSSWSSTDGQHEIDIVGTATRRPTFVGSVKWRREPLGEAVLNDLERDAVLLGARDVPRLLVGRGGARADIAARAGVRGVSADDLYR